MIAGKQTVKCPLCGGEGVTAFVKPSYLQGKTSRISAGAKTTYHRVPESVEYQGSCPNCGKSAAEMQRATKSGLSGKRLSHEERMRRLRESGFPTTIGTSASDR